VRLEVNPVGTAEAHLAALRRCFPEWGDEHKYAWYFKARAGVRTPDVLALSEASQWVAGLGLTYRTVQSAIGERHEVAILTGAWTLPSFRGHGLFSKLVAAAREQARHAGAIAVLGFVRANNPSKGALERLGAQMVETGYWTGALDQPAGVESRLRTVALGESLAADLWRRLGRITTATHFHYQTAASFEAQYLSRPQPSVVLADRSGNHAILERDRGGLSVLFTSKGDGGADAAADFPRRLRAFALEHGYTLSLFNCGAHKDEDLLRAGLLPSPGFLCVLEDDKRDQAWIVQGGDRA